MKKRAPLYAERPHRNEVQIKIAQPSKWISKAKWVYQETHPWEDFTETSYYIFLDGDNRNFNPSNIERLSYRYVGVFYQLGGSVRGKPDLTRLRIAQAKLKVAQLDVGEKLGLVRNYGKGRTFRDEYNEINRIKHREYLRKWRRKNKR